MARCGCDCKNQTIDADSEANEWPCCDVFPDGVPCRYAVIAECYVVIPSTLDWPWLLSGEYDDGNWPLMWPVFELRKGCFSGCDWHLRQYVYNDPERRYLGNITDQVELSLNPSFPPASYDGANITYHEADYRDSVYSESPYFEGCYAPYLTFPGSTDVLESQWTLSITGSSTGGVTLTMGWASLLMASGRSTTPVYSSMQEWNEFGRNTLELSTESSAEWPELPRRICVVALDDPGITNPCTSHAEQCACCDPGTDTASITGNFSGCGRVSGEVTWTGTRYKSPTALPAGVSYPASNPCGVFWGTIGSGGDGCSSGGVTWSGSVGLMTYCDGETWAGKAYCYDAVLEEWVEQGDLTISGIECRCGGVYFDVDLPTLDCCCDGGATTCEELEALGVPIVADDGTNQITLTYDGGLGYWTYSGAGTFAGCTDGSWVWQCVATDPIEGYFAHSPSGQSCAPAGTLSPFDFSCTFFGCDANPYTVTFTE